MRASSIVLRRGLTAILDENERDISPLANWSVSSHKYGFGVDNLKSPDPELFWQCVEWLGEISNAPD